MPDLETENIVLKAQKQWLINVNQKLLVMIDNVSIVFDEYIKQVHQIETELRKTKEIYSNLHSELQEALNEQGTNSDKSST